MKQAFGKCAEKRLRAEWEQQAAILLAFPHTRSDWASKIDKARQCFLDIIESIIAFERVLVCIDIHDTQGLAVLCRHFGSDMPPLTPYTTHTLTPQITLAFVPTNDTWARDFGVITCEIMDSNARDSALGKHSADFGDFEATADHQSSSAPKPPKNYESPTATPRILEEENQARCEKSAQSLESTFENATNLNEPAKDSRVFESKAQSPKHKPTQATNLLLDFSFNGWGLKYPSNFDNQITKSLHKLGTLGQLPLESSSFILEGGSIDTDGLGTILTTTACLLEPNRNATYTKAEIESTLCQSLGVKRVLWLENGFLQGDDTDSHIDMLARFLAPDTIAYISCDDTSDPHYHALQAMEQEILAFRQANGRAYKLCRLPFVRAIYDELGERLPASYANFLFVNGALLVPIYDDPSDTQALALLKEALPNRAVLGVNARTLIEWHGSLHCVSMQLY